GVALDSSGTLFVINNNTGTLTEYAKGATGDAAPLVTLSGNSFNNPYDVAVLPIATPPATVPGAPIVGQALAGNASAYVTFSPPASTGGSLISSYTVSATDVTNAARGGQTVTGTGSPLVIGGLTNGDTYTFSVDATNGVGTGPSSGPSNAVTPSPTAPPGAPN